MVKRVSELIGGETIRTEDETPWGWRVGWHKIAAIHCDAKDHLVELEVRENQTLLYRMRLNPADEVVVR